MSNKRPEQTQGVGEQLKELGKGIVTETAKTVTDIGSGIFQELLGLAGSKKDQENPQAQVQKALENYRESKKEPTSTEIHKKITPEKKKFNIFAFSEYRENVLVKQRIEQLLTEIRAEIKAFKQSAEAITAEVYEIEKTTLQALPEKAGVYHIRFLEFILSLIRTLRSKTAESKTWLAALMSKKKKRGSLFAALSKKKGTQYSLSEELKIARSTQ